MITMVSRKDVSDTQRLVKQNKKVCLLDLCETIHKKVHENNGTMPYKFMRALVKEKKMNFNWFTRDMIHSSFTQYKKRRRMNHNLSKEQPTIFKIRFEKNGTKCGTSLYTFISDFIFDTQNSTIEDNVNVNEETEKREECLLVQQIITNKS